MDRPSLVTGRTETEAVADSVRPAALFVELAGSATLKTFAKCDGLDGLLGLIPSSLSES